MSFTFDNDFDPDKMYTGAGPIPEGFYHVRLENAELIDDSRGDKWKLSWLIVGATKENVASIGREISEFLNSWTQDKKGNSIFFRIFARMGDACGFYPDGYLRNAKANNLRIESPDFTQWVGRSCIAKVSHSNPKDDEKGRVFGRIGFDFFRKDSTESKESAVLLNQEIVKYEANLPTVADAVAADDQF